ncbi:DUF6504 family protein [Streptomonospora litoralis]|uniref:DUF6504 domain-containing protein n=1 Tax=Streptomonospora litoralis TaxID=2498135 RepID=A0A4P6Q7J8_9ACTN|nr:DUF6504 family protein [Streptomonospora litoralis]QBI55411.1 hypothetical protein EKD16_18235 [Streptomonospora litoralis]
MGHVYGVPVDVTEQDGRPVRFVWERRVYNVRHIVDHWVTLRADWPSEAQERLPQREHWRVEAGGRGARGVYELQHDSASDRWLLARVWD